MGRLTVLALRIVLAMVLAGSLFVQAVMVPLLAIDLKEDFDPSLASPTSPFSATPSRTASSAASCCRPTSSTPACRGPSRRWARPGRACCDGTSDAPTARSATRWCSRSWPTSGRPFATGSRHGCRDQPPEASRPATSSVPPRGTHDGCSRSTPEIRSGSSRQTEGPPVRLPGPPMTLGRGSSRPCVRDAQGADSDGMDEPW